MTRFFKASIFAHGVDQNATGEDVIPHRTQRHRRIARHRGWHFGFFLEAGDAPLVVDLKDAKFRGLGNRHRNGSNADVSFSFAVKVDHLLNVHLENMVTAEHRD